MTVWLPFFSRFNLVLNLTATVEERAGRGLTRDYALVLVKPYIVSLFSTGEVGDYTKRWQRKSRGQGARAAEPYRNSR